MLIEIGHAFNDSLKNMVRSIGYVHRSLGFVSFQRLCKNPIRKLPL